MTSGGFWIAGANLPFAIAGGLVVALALLELLSLLIGSSISGVLDGAVDVDLDTDADVPALAWIGLGVIPVFALGVVLLTLFALSGYAIQAAVFQANRALMAATFAAFLALIPTLLLAGPLARVLRKHLFKDETEALSADDLLGGTATITLGETYAGHPTQAKIVDKYRTTHYVLVEPLNADDRFDSGDAVTLVRRESARFLVVAATAEALFDSLDTSKK